MPVEAATLPSALPSGVLKTTGRLAVGFGQPSGLSGNPAARTGCTDLGRRRQLPGGRCGDALRTSVASQEIRAGAMTAFR